MIKLYKNTIEIDFAENTHRYKVNGNYVIGVSTVLGVLAKDLTGWAAWMSAEAFKEAVRPFATSDRKMTKTALKRMADEAKEAHRRKSQLGMDVGTIVHKWIEEETAKGQKIKVPTYVSELLLNAEDNKLHIIAENVDIAEHCIKQWRLWKEDGDIEIIKSEFVVYSKKLNYCGTGDVIFKYKGKTYVGDYKTSEPKKTRDKLFRVKELGAYPEHFAQTAAYDYANHEESGFEPDGYAVIYLPKTENYRMFTRRRVKEDRIAWEHLFRAYEWITKIRKGL